MKLYFEDDTGKRIEIKNVKGLGKGTVIIFSEALIHKDKIAEMEYELSRKLQRDVVIIGPWCRDIAVIPPLDRCQNESKKTDAPH